MYMYMVPTSPHSLKSRMRYISVASNECILHGYFDGAYIWINHDHGEQNS